MAEIEPLRALHYDLERTGGLQDVVAPPYDVIDARAADASSRRARRTTWSGSTCRSATATPTTHAAEQLARVAQATASIVRDEQPALWALEQDYTGPDGQRAHAPGVPRARARRGVRRRADPPPRAHPPRPKEDRLQAHARDQGQPLPDLLAVRRSARRRHGGARARAPARPPWGADDRRRRHGQPAVAGRRPRRDRAGHRRGASGAELLIADGHHRYETARVYAEEIGGEGPHRYVLMCLVALEDPGLTVFPTHRLVRGLRPDQHETLADAIRRDFDDRAARQHRRARARRTAQPVRIGYIDAHFRQPFMLTLKDPAIADAALSDHAEPYRRLDTAVLEALILKGALGMTDEDIDHLDGLELRARLRPGARAGRERRVRRRVLHGADADRAGPGGRRAPARACLRSRPTSSPRSRPACCSTRSTSSGRTSDATTATMSTEHNVQPTRTSQ